MTDAKKTKQALAERIVAQLPALLEWQREQRQEAPPPFYSSIDLRDSGYKIVPVDSNLYPAGFNNICPEDLRTAPPVFRDHIAGLGPGIQKILVIPEAHTTNRFYIENLYYLLQIIENAGFEARLGWYGDSPEFPVKLVSASEKQLAAHKIEINGGVISAGGFTPDLVILNNDFSSGYPQPLDGVTQPILPSHALGWHTRKKTAHFHHYNKLAGDFARIIGVDPWSIQIDTEEVAPVNFDEEQGIEQTAQTVEKMLERLKAAHEARGIKKAPFVFVKNNSGTYGMGIMVVHSAEELRNLNRRTKHKMTVGKNKSVIGSVAVQEGVPTTTLVQRLPAEPVIYLFGAELIGGFLRTNTERGDEDNLNSQGMAFKMLCMSDLRDPTVEGFVEDPKKWPVLELLYGWIARISALAAGRELAELKRGVRA